MSIDGDLLAEHEGREVLARDGVEGLLGFGRIDVREADFVLDAGGVEDGDGVAVA